MRLLIIGALGGHVIEAAHMARSKGVQVTHVEDTSAALAFLRQGGADIIFIDIQLDIVRFIQNLLSEHINTPVIGCGIGHENQLAVKAIRAGAKEYIPLPPDSDVIAAILESLGRHEHTMIHADPKMQKVVQLAEQIAQSDASVLITGESGTGKEIVARHIHQKSRRLQAAFISVNCAAIPENLLESELFGHEKGAFTGAVARRIGKFEEANGGTLLLDEVTEMHPRLQAKLLRAIQEREIDRVGGSKPVKVNIRLLATSNRDMETAVKEGIFREDLYFRLNVVSLKVPALRERPEDIAPLAHFFVKKYVQVNALSLKTLSQESIEFLKSYNWRGNVRELENTIHRSVVLSQDSIIAPADIYLPTTTLETNLLEKNPQAFGSQPLVGKTVAEVERDLILNTLSHFAWNRTQAAMILGISIRTLRNKLRQYQSEGLPISESQMTQAS